MVSFWENRCVGLDTIYHHSPIGCLMGMTTLLINQAMEKGVYMTKLTRL